MLNLLHNLLKQIAGKPKRNPPPSMRELQSARLLGSVLDVTASGVSDRASSHNGSGRDQLSPARDVSTPRREPARLELTPFIT